MHPDDPHCELCHRFDTQCTWEPCPEHDAEKNAAYWKEVRRFYDVDDKPAKEGRYARRMGGRDV